MKKILFLLCLMGCGPLGQEGTKKEAQNIEYYKDSRTNLCFVRNIVCGSDGCCYNVFANVPCTPEVEKLLIK
jgi:hypothetical protein